MNWVLDDEAKDGRSRRFFHCFNHQDSRKWIIESTGQQFRSSFKWIRCGWIFMKQAYDIMRFPIKLFRIHLAIFDTCTCISKQSKKSWSLFSDRNIILTHCLSLEAINKAANFMLFRYVTATPSYSSPRSISVARGTLSKLAWSMQDSLCSQEGSMTCWTWAATWWALLK